MPASLFARKTGRHEKGFSVVDCLFAFLVLGIGSLSLMALMSTLGRSHYMSDEMSRAVQIASRQLEQLRIVKYENLEPEKLSSLGLIDPWDGSGPLTFSKLPGEEAVKFSVSHSLKKGIGEVEINDVSDTVREVIVRVKWEAPSGKTRSVELSAIIGKY
ncbi:MAG TPA: hypothetical protein VNK96_00940 [Fimbriimonadales bacterium]|nr:hypothetical protein [Fimbriimonadales bacterium]